MSNRQEKSPHPNYGESANYLFPDNLDNEPHVQLDLWLEGALETMRGYEENTFCAVVTDPPYELGFMGAEWDSTGIAYSVELWREVSRILKPGGHLLSFGGTRTYHRMACAIEDAGFEIRDQIQWIHGQGFPKSFDISKGIDKMAGAEREVIGINPNCWTPKDNSILGGGKGIQATGIDKNITAPATPEAKEWQGYGTALKPAHEPICLARNPISEKTVVENVLRWDTGALNIDETRIEINGEIIPINKLKSWSGFGQEVRPEYEATANNQGRFPANVIFDEEAGRLLDEQSEHKIHGAGGKREPEFIPTNQNIKFKGSVGTNYQRFGDKGGTSRFFYVAKADKSEREDGLIYRIPCSICGRKDSLTHEIDGKRYDCRRNFHKTVKPLSLMRYLCRMIRPPRGGIIFDPFMGSGTTGKAALIEGLSFAGCDNDPETFPIAHARIYHEWEIIKTLGIDYFTQKDKIIP